MKYLAPILLGLLAVSALGAATPSAAQVMAEAEAKAAAEHKAIYVHFGASWCIWCTRLESYLDDPAIKPVFEKYFVPVKLVVQESGDKISLENAGGDALMKEWGGPAGLPYSAFLDAQGSIIINSKRDGVENIGFPNNHNETTWFLNMVKTAAPSITDEDLSTLKSRLNDSVPPPRPIQHMAPGSVITRFDARANNIQRDADFAPFGINVNIVHLNYAMLLVDVMLAFAGLYFLLRRN